MSHVPSLYIYTNNYSNMNEFQRLAVDKEIHRRVRIIAMDEIEFEVGITKKPRLPMIAEKIVARLIKTGVYTTDKSKVNETKRMPKIFIDGDKIQVNGDLFTVSEDRVYYQFSEESASLW